MCLSSFIYICMCGVVVFGLCPVLYVEQCSLLWAGHQKNVFKVMDELGLQRLGWGAEKESHRGTNAAISQMV